MPDEKLADEKADENAETPVDEENESAPKAAAKSTGPRGPTSILTHATDHAPRPGFRATPNKRTKAQKQGKKKGR